MYHVLRATYRNGSLIPDRELPLSEQEQVLIVVLSPAAAPGSRSSGSSRLAALREQAETWLLQQPADAVRPPSPLPDAQDQRIDAGFEAALGQLHSRASRLGEAEIAADVDAAVVAVRQLSPEERARLDDELKAVLAEWTTDAG